MESKHYWDKKIIEWENSMRGSSDISFIERIAAYFRKPLRFRSQLAVELLSPLVRGEKVVDLGCGSGFFDFDLFERATPARILGVDISSQAVLRAQEIAQKKWISERVEFIEADVTTFQPPEALVTVGLGFLDYLTMEEIRGVFERLRSPYFFFSFAERTLSLTRYIHILYLLSQRCPKHFYYTKDEIAGCINTDKEQTHFINDPRLSFACIIHNLPTQK